MSVPTCSFADPSVARCVCDRSIRQALLFALSMTVLSLPAHTLITDLHDEMSETRDWLQGTMSLVPIILSVPVSCDITVHNMTPAVGRPFLYLLFPLYPSHSFHSLFITYIF